MTNIHVYMYKVKQYWNFNEIKNDLKIFSLTFFLFFFKWKIWLCIWWPAAIWQCLTEWCRLPGAAGAVTNLGGPGKLLVTPPLGLVGDNKSNWMGASATKELEGVGAGVLGRGWPPVLDMLWKTHQKRNQGNQKSNKQLYYIYIIKRIQVNKMGGAFKTNERNGTPLPCKIVPTERYSIHEPNINHKMALW